MTALTFESPTRPLTVEVTPANKVTIPVVTEAELPEGVTAVGFVSEYTRKARDAGRVLGATCHPPTRPGPEHRQILVVDPPDDPIRVAARVWPRIDIPSELRCTEVADNRWRINALGRVRNRLNNTDPANTVGWTGTLEEFLEVRRTARVSRLWDQSFDTGSIKSTFKATPNGLIDPTDADGSSRRGRISRRDDVGFHHLWLEYTVVDANTDETRDELRLVRVPASQLRIDTVPDGDPRALSELIQRRPYLRETHERLDDVLVYELSESPP